MEIIKEWSSLAATLISLGTMVYVFLTASAKKTADDLAGFKKSNGEYLNGHDRKLREHDRRIQKLENEVEHLPSKDDVHELRLGVEQVKGSLGRLEESNLGMARAVRRVESHLLKDKG